MHIIDLLLHFKNYNKINKFYTRNLNKLFKEEKLSNKFKKFKEIKHLNSDQKIYKNKNHLNNKKNT
jgi:transposase